MTTVELAQLAKACRDAQRAYFKYRCESNLNAAKTAEAALDKAVHEVLNPIVEQPKLF